MVAEGTLAGLRCAADLPVTVPVTSAPGAADALAAALPDAQAVEGALRLTCPQGEKLALCAASRIWGRRSPIWIWCCPVWKTSSLQPEGRTMTRILATAQAEMRIAARNRWLAIAAALMVVFALVLSAAGAAPTGDLGVDRLSVVVASLTSLAVYLRRCWRCSWPLTPGTVGEVERGTLPLLLTYPVARWQVLTGKLLAHLAILALALLAGYGAAAAAALWADPGCGGGACGAGAAVLDLGPFGGHVPGRGLCAVVAGAAASGGGAGGRAVAGDRGVLRSGAACGDRRG